MSQVSSAFFTLRVWGSMGRLRVMNLMCFVLVVGVAVGVEGLYIKYNTGGGPVEGKLNVHLVPHSHDDVGWLKTVDQYYVGSNNSIQGASVENVLDSVVMALLRDSNRRFVFVEQAFFQRWWRDQSDEIQAVTKNLVASGRLEFINGGWCMHDEAATHYIDMIDQTTLGHLMIKNQFNFTPRVGWQIDPFGHSAVQAYLLGAELGFDSLHFARIDYQDRAKRKADRTLEVVWQGSKTFGSSAQIFTNAFPVHYSPPSGFHFEVNDDSAPVQDDPLLFDYNVEQRVNDFVNAAMDQANLTRTNHIMWTMGDDFQYQYAETWYKQLDKFIHYVNKDGRVNAFYSTPSLYTDCKHSANEVWPLKTDDYFPYADAPNAYWTGYFTSRPSLKGYIRKLSGYYVAARQLEYFAGRKPFGPNTFSLGDSLGIAQHHDAVTGTAKQHTTNDYAKRLSIGATEAELTTNIALACLTDLNSTGKCEAANTKFSQCRLLNISYCPPTEEAIAQGKSLIMVAYNSLGWARKDIIRIPVNDNDLMVRDASGKNLEVQYINMDNATSNLRSFYLEAYMGISSKAPKYWLLFEGSVPPLGWSTYFISKTNGTDPIEKSDVSSSNDTIEVGPGNLKITFSLISGQMNRMTNINAGVDVPVQQSYMYYISSIGDEEDSQASGAYIFRPTDSPPIITSRSVPLSIVQGNLVHEVHQQFNSWISQVTRLYRDMDHAEIEFTIGPIPTDDGLGKEVITRMTANMATNKIFYTDSNGRDFLKRVRDYRADWTLDVHQPVSGNYYPINLGIFMSDEKSEFSILVDRAVGGGSIQDGEIEIMLHRRMLNDDSRGVGEPLDEIVCANNSCEGLTIQGKYYVSIDKLGSGTRWRRTVGQQIYSPLLFAFTQEDESLWKASRVTTKSTMDSGYTLPPNTAIITLQELDDATVLLRLAHLYEAGEDAEYSIMAEVDLKRVFANKMIKEVKETSLSANQEKSEMKRLVWKVEGDSAASPKVVKGGSLNGTSIVQLGPMEIRTFLVKFN